MTSISGSGPPEPTHQQKKLDWAHTVRLHYVANQNYSDAIKTTGDIQRHYNIYQHSVTGAHMIPTFSDRGCIENSMAEFQLGWEKGRVQKKLGTIQRANNQNSGTIQCANDT